MLFVRRTFIVPPSTLADTTSVARLAPLVAFSVNAGFGAVVPFSTTHWLHCGPTACAMLMEGGTSANPLLSGRTWTELSEGSSDAIVIVLLDAGRFQVWSNCGIGSETNSAMSHAETSARTPSSVARRIPERVVIRVPTGSDTRSHSGEGFGVRSMGER